MTLLRRLGSIRRWVAHRLWNLAARFWVPAEEERRDVAYWEMNATYRGREDEADRIFEAMCDLGDTVLGLHPSDTRFVVGGMRRTEAESEDEND